MPRSRRMRPSPTDRAAPRRPRASDLPAVPTVSPNAAPERPGAQEKPGEDPAEAAVRRMVEAAYT
jgi:hypothetical protein